MKNKIGTYRWWDVLDTLPSGWRVDKNTGSPLTGAVFVMDKSPLMGGKKALLRVANTDSINKVISEYNSIKNKVINKQDKTTKKEVANKNSIFRIENNEKKMKKRTMSLKQAKALAKGQKIQKRAMQILKESGQKTITKKVYNTTLGKAMKQAAEERK
jgi:hypothetical protein